jgi:hypothetical protein
MATALLPGERRKVANAHAEASPYCCGKFDGNEMVEGVSMSSG